MSTRKIIHRATIEVNVELTLQQLADIIAGLRSDYQACLISLIAEAVNCSAPIQLQYVTDDDAMTPAGRRLMELIGDYAHPSQPTPTTETLPMPSDSKRLRYLMVEVEGFRHLPRDRYDYATQVAELNGHEEANATDELDGFRQMIDDAMAADTTTTPETPTDD